MYRLPRSSLAQAIRTSCSAVQSAAKQSPRDQRHTQPADDDQADGSPPTEPSDSPRHHLFPASGLFSALQSAERGARLQGPACLLHGRVGLQRPSGSRSA